MEPFWEQAKKFEFKSTVRRSHMLKKSSRYCVDHHRIESSVLRKKTETKQTHLRLHRFVRIDLKCLKKGKSAFVQQKSKYAFLSDLRKRMLVLIHNFKFM